MTEIMIGKSVADFESAFPFADAVLGLQSESPMRCLLALLMSSALAAACTSQISPTGGGDDDDSGGGPGDDEFNGPDAAICDQVTPIELQEPQPPDLLLTVDKSGSMAEPLGTGEMKWLVMRTALTNLTTEYERGINFGLMTFPTGSVCDAGSVQADVGPQRGDVAVFQDRLREHHVVGAELDTRHEAEDGVFEDEHGHGG